MDKSLSPLEALKKSSRWLNEYQRDVYSQTGEDGVIAQALTLLPATDHWCVEFGAWDGKHLSNTYHLVESSAYNVVLVEGDAAKYESLRRDYPFKDRAIFVHQYVGWTSGDTLDTILEKHPVPKNFDLLSIDVDGNDYHIWKATEKFRPKLVLIEFNPTSSNRLDYVQPADPKVNQSNSPAALVRLGKEKGYELICVIGPNLLLVDREYFDLFHIPDNSLEILREEDEVTKLFLGFDGSLLVDGPAHLRWHNLPLKVSRPLPKFLTQYPPTYSESQKFWYRVWVKLFFGGARRKKSS